MMIQRFLIVATAVMISLRAASADPLPVAPSANPFTLSQAIALAISNNLTTKLAKAATEEARGKVIEAAAALLPQISADVQQSRTFKVNLAAQGFPENSPVFSPILGPFDTFDARFRLVQTLLDFNSFWANQAARSSKRISQDQERLAREQVAAAAAMAYLEAQRSQRAVIAAQSDLSLSQSLSKLARDQHQSGVATGVDVARAETDEAQERLRLIRAQISAQEADLRLKRTVGLPLSTTLIFPETLPVGAVSPPPLDASIQQAETDRAEIQIALETLKLAGYGLGSARAGYLPTIKATADYGFSGNLPTSSTARTGSIGGQLDLPIFSGGQTHGQVVQSKAVQDEAESRYNDMRQQIEEDIRLSIDELIAEIQETQTADQALALAQTELKMARDRYAAGVGDNIQVLNAQTSLSRAYDDQVDALARYDDARVNVAAALGHAEDFQ